MTQALALAPRNTMESKDKMSMMLQKLPSEIETHGIEQQGHVKGLNNAEDLSDTNQKPVSLGLQEGLPSH